MMTKNTINEPEMVVLDNHEAVAQQTIKRRFVSKVFGFITFELIFTGIFIAIVGYTNVGTWVLNQPQVADVMGLITLVILVVLGNIKRIWNTTKFKIILWSLFTITGPYTVAYTTLIAFNVEDVLLGLTVTIIVCISLILFAYQTKWDYTLMTGTIFVLIILLFVSGIILSVFPSKIELILYLSIAEIIFCLFSMKDVLRRLHKKLNPTVENNSNV